MNFVGILGTFSSILTIVAYLPQVIKSWKTREMKDLSFWTLLFFIIASITWSTYGFLKGDFAVVGTNITLLLFQLSLMYLKVIDK